VLSKIPRRLAHHCVKRSNFCSFQPMRESHVINFSKSSAVKSTTGEMDRLSITNP
jgi:hypothetical protein